MRSKKFKSKFYKKSFTSIYRILRCIGKGMYPSQIARQLNLPKQNINYFIRKLEAQGFIKRELRTNIACYVLTDSGVKLLEHLRSKKFSLPSRKSDTSIRLHNLVIKFPILKDNPNAKWERVGEEINNWVAKYSVVEFPVGITIKKTPKSIIVYFHQFYTRREQFLSDFYNWVLRGIYYVYFFLLKDKGIQIDLLNAKVIREHIANESPEFNETVPKKKTVEVRFKRKARSIFPSVSESRAWIDRSFGNVDIETNDMIYEEKLLLMPEIIYALDKKLAPTLEKLSEQINLHLSVLRKISKAIEKLNERLDKLG